MVQCENDQIANSFTILLQENRNIFREYSDDEPAPSIFKDSKCVTLILWITFISAVILFLFYLYMEH